MRKGGQIYFLKKETADFFLLDDQTIFPKINKLIKYIQQAGYNPTVLKVKDISQLNQQIWSRGWYAPEFRYVGIGDGGRSVLSQLVKCSPPDSLAVNRLYFATESGGSNFNILPTIA